MTFKPLDLQMSVPRTQEFSGMQQQAAQRPQAEQNILANQTSKQTEEMRNQNTAIEQSSKPQVRADQDSANDSGHKRGARKKADGTDEDTSSDEPPVHPYKGHHLDIKL